MICSQGEITLTVILKPTNKEKSQKKKIIEGIISPSKHIRRWHPFII